MAAVDDAPVMRATVLDLNGESNPVGPLIRDAWRGRGLIVMLAKRDFQSKFRSSSLGLVWSVLLPFVQGTVLAVVFTHVVRIHTAGVSYPIYVLMGSTLWSYFAIAFPAASSIIVSQAGLAGRLYFPRSLLAAVPVLSALPSFLLSNLVLLALMPVFDARYTWRLLLLPAVVVALVVFATLLGSILTIVHVYVRDMAFAVTAGMGIWYYATPVIYPLTLAKGLANVAVFNPMVGVVQLEHWAFFGTALGPLAVPMEILGGWIVLLLMVAVLVYRRHERIACDRL